MNRVRKGVFKPPVEVNHEFLLSKGRVIDDPDAFMDEVNELTVQHREKGLTVFKFLAVKPTGILYQLRKVFYASRGERVRTTLTYDTEKAEANYKLLISTLGVLINEYIGLENAVAVWVAVDEDDDFDVKWVKLAVLKPVLVYEYDKEDLEKAGKHG